MSSSRPRSDESSYLPRKERVLELSGQLFRLSKQLGKTSSVQKWMGTDATGERLVMANGVDLTRLSSGARLRLEHEGNVLASTRHPNLVPLLAAGAVDEQYWLVSDFVDGRLLRDFLKLGETLSVGAVVRLGRGLFAALAELHEHGMLHPGIHPRCLMLSGDQKDVLLAWSVSHDALAAEPMSAEAMLDIARYSSPERNQVIPGEVGEVSDIYAAAAVLYHCLSGRPPFEADNLNQLLRLQTTKTVPRISVSGQELPLALDDLLQRALARDPSGRYQTAAAVLYDLELIQSAMEDGRTDVNVVVGTRDTRKSLAPPAFVSREGELALLAEQSASLRRGAGGIVVVEGASGLGKSRLLDEYELRSSQAGFLVLKGRGTRDAHHPLALLKTLLTEFQSACQSHPQILEQVRGRLGDQWNDLVRVLPVLKGDEDQTAGDRSDGRLPAENEVLTAILTFAAVVGSAQQPVLIVLDDCQWEHDLVYRLAMRWQMDNEAIPEGQRHVQLVIAYRSEEVSADNQLRRIAPQLHLEVGPLMPREVRLLLESMAGPLPDAAVDVVIRLAQGSPFMAMAMLNGLVESRALYFQRNAWQVEMLALDNVRSSAHAGEFLAQRLSLLDAETLHLMQAGALLGVEFSLEMAAHLSGVSMANAWNAVNVARRRQLLWWSRTNGSCQFVHDKVREALEQSQQPDDRKRFHRLAADFLLGSQPERHAQLAVHLYESEQPEAAVGFALLAAKEARSRHALDLAEQQYRIAKNCAGHASTSTHFAIAEGLGDVLMLKGQYPEAEEQFERAGRLAATAEARAEVCCRRGQLWIKRGDMHAAVAQFQLGLEMLGIGVPQRRFSIVLGLVSAVLVQAVHTVLGRWVLHRVPRRPNELERLILRLYSGYSHASWYSSKLSLLMWAHLRGMNLAERFQPSAELAQIYSDHAPGMTLIPWHGRGLKYAQRSLAIRQSLGDLWGQGQSWHFYGIVQYAAGRYEECLDACRQAVQILQRTGDFWQVHIARYQIAASLFHLGDLRGALEESRRNHVSGLMVGDEQASGIILDVWARVSPGAVPDDLLRAELDRERHDFQGAAQVQLAAGIQRLAQGRLDEAQQHLEQALGIIRSSGVRNQYTTPVAAWMTTVLRRQAESRELLTGQLRYTLLKRAERMARQAWLESWWCRNDLAHVLRERALLAAMRGRTSQSRRLFDRSLRIAEQAGARFEFALTLKERARVGLECGWPEAEAQGIEARRQLAGLIISDADSGAAGSSERRTSVSVVDRFETLLKTGREVVSSLTRDAIREQLVESAKRLLRVEGAQLILWEEETPGDECVSRNPALLERVRQSGQLLTTFGSIETPEKESSLYVPVSTRGEVAGCLVVTQRELPRAFGPDEEKIAEFLATLAGAALENAEGFARLEQMNSTLEDRVAERTRRLNERADLLITSYSELEQTTDNLRRTQQELVASTRAAEAANQAKSRFLAAISHEIRTPMNGVIGMAELALATELSDRQRTYVNTINQSAKTLLALLNDILDFSKIEAGKLELEQRLYNLHETVIESVRLMSVSAIQKGLELRCHVAPNVPERLTGDATRLRQVLLNLLGNAIKFTTTGSVVVEVRLGEHQEIELSVVDTGIGIPPDRQQRIFQAFDQGEVSMSRRFGGTGLGLAICRELVTLMGGRISLTSELNVGSRFCVQLPLEVSASEFLPTKDAIAKTGLRVLVVSTSPAIAAGHAEWLDYWGDEATTATDLEEAKMLLADGRAWDLLLVDAAMPASGEAAFLAEIERCQWLPAGGALLLAPAGAEEYLERMEHRDPTLLVLKPITPRSLREHLQSRLQTMASPVEAPKTTPIAEVMSLQVLVVDDSPINLDVAAGLVELMGHEVKTAGGGEAALERMREQQFDVVLMDVDMPDLDGLATTQQWRLREQGRPARILAMSAHIADEVREHCLDAGMDGFLSKPVDSVQMREVLARVAREFAIES
ncbi:MAG: response regulator [Planctomycetaceae bacterium]